jgi:hypothetical protein
MKPFPIQFLAPHDEVSPEITGKTQTGKIEKSHGRRRYVTVVRENEKREAFSFISCRDLRSQDRLHSHLP